MAASDLGVYFLDVGQGDCTFVVPPAGEGAPILFDCADQLVAERFCTHHAITDLHAVIASHLDIDHVRGMLPFLLGHFGAGRRVRRLVVGRDRAASDEKNLQALIEQAVKWETAPPHADFVLDPPFRTGDGAKLIAQGDGWRVDLVLPFYGTVQMALGGRTPNRCSAVLRVERGGTVVMIGGDATLASWERLEPGLRGASVFRTSHHGGDILDGNAWTSYGDLFDAVGANAAIVSVGSNNGHGHPVPAHLTAARRAGACRLLCTQVTPRCSANSLALREGALDAGAGVEWPYRHRALPGHSSTRHTKGETPCAGSVVVRVAKEGTVSVEPPPNGWHEALVDKMDTPLCR